MQKSLNLNAFHGLKKSDITELKSMLTSKTQFQKLFSSLMIFFEQFYGV